MSAPLRTEPAVTIGSAAAVAAAVLGLLVAFGIDITDDQQKAILGVISVLTPIVAAFLVRRRVTPVGGEHRRES